MRNSNSHTRTVKTKLNKSKNIFRAYNDIQFKHGNPESKVLRGRDQRREQLLRLHPFHPRGKPLPVHGGFGKGRRGIARGNEPAPGSGVVQRWAPWFLYRQHGCPFVGHSTQNGLHLLLRWIDGIHQKPIEHIPRPRAITRIAKYTEKVYVTSLVDETSEKGYQPFNGTITCSSIAGLGIDDLEIQCSHSNVILKDSEWFQSHRTWPSS